jgi:hypothetical protein
MKNLLIAAGMLAVSASAASAQFGPPPFRGPAPPPPGYDRSIHPYEGRHHRVCQEKSFRLHQFERRAASDGRLDRRERAIIRDLERDLARTCGGHRHRGF